MEKDYHKYQGEGLLPVVIESEPGGVETSLLIRSLQAALESCIREDERFCATSLPVAVSPVS